jgi:diamine N-acetyltransferase
MIRKVNLKDKDKYIDMSKQFYRSDAVSHNIPDDNIRETFNIIMAGSPYADGYIFENKGEIAGYLLLSFTYSNEAGGLVLWIEEVYILPEYQGRGFGIEFLTFIEKTYKNKVARIRLEVEKSNQKAIKLYKKIGFTNLDYLQMYK